MDNSIGKKNLHYIRFTTTNWGENEYTFETEPIVDCPNAAIDHHVQCRIVAYMKLHNIRGKDQKHIYYDSEMKEIMHNDTALEHATFEVPKEHK